MANNDGDLFFKQVYKLYKEAYSPKEDIANAFDYYLGNYSKEANQKQKENANNVIKQIIDTKATFLVDNMLTCTVAPQNLSLADLKQIKDIQDSADILNDCLSQVLEANHMDSKKSTIARDMEICGFCPVEVSWEQEDGIGEAKVNIIQPKDFMWDKAASSIDNANYCVIKMSMSSQTLKKKYATNRDGSLNEEMIGKINKISGKQGQKDNTSSQKLNAITTGKNDQQAFQAYVFNNNDLSVVKTVDVIKLYMKDDSVFMPESADSSQDVEAKSALRGMYPNGRVILFAGDESNYVIFEDKPIDYPFGFPIVIFNPIDLNTIESKGEVQDLIFVQDRINRAYGRLKDLIQQYLSAVLVSEKINLNGDDLARFPVIKVQGTPGDAFAVVTNNTLGEIQSLTGYIDMLKRDAKEIARINDIMMSGELPSGNIKSGAMVEALKESPQSAIRGLQRIFKDRYIDLCNKLVVLIQNHYNVERIVKIASGDEFARIPTTQIDGQGRELPQPIQILDKNGQLVKEIKNFAQLDFNVEIIAGTEMPRSRSENAQLVDRLFNMGLLGNQQDIDVKEWYFKSIDLPNYRAIVDMQKKKQESMSQNPPPVPLTDKITVAFKDLPIEWMDAWGAQNGFPPLQQNTQTEIGNAVGGTHQPKIPAEVLSQLLSTPLTGVNQQGGMQNV